MRALLALLACAAALAGCGLGAGEEQAGGGVQVRVTRDFGRDLLAQARERRVREGETVMRALRSRFEVETRYGGRFVQAIDGVAGTGSAARGDWFYFVNGVEADVGAAEYELSPGDVVQWDLRSWAAAMRVPAIVGAYPQPFRSAREGKRLPVRLECGEPDSQPCRDVRRRLLALGTKAGSASLGASGGTEILRVVVAPWRQARVVGAVAALADGPSSSGVFARVVDDGRALELLDERGRTARRAPPGTGLVAALAPRPDELTWLVTGLDARGVGAAARSLDERRLRDAYAVAALPDGTVKLPLRSAS